MVLGDGALSCNSVLLAYVWGLEADLPDCLVPRSLMTYLHLSALHASLLIVLLPVLYLGPVYYCG